MWASERNRKPATSASSSAQVRLTSDRRSRLHAQGLTRLSTLQMEVPRPQASHHRRQGPVDAATRLQHQQDGKELDLPQLGVLSSTAPAFVDSSRA